MSSNFCNPIKTLKRCGLEINPRDILLHITKNQTADMLRLMIS